jgi:hypothetical protein
LVQHERGGDAELHDHETLGSNAVRQTGGVSANSKDR